MEVRHWPARRYPCSTRSVTNSPPSLLFWARASRGCSRLPWSSRLCTTFPFRTNSGRRRHCAHLQMRSSSISSFSSYRCASSRRMRSWCGIVRWPKGSGSSSSCRSPASFSLPRSVSSAQRTTPIHVQRSRFYALPCLRTVRFLGISPRRSFRTIFSMGTSRASPTMR